MCWGLDYSQYEPHVESALGGMDHEDKIGGIIYKIDPIYDDALVGHVQHIVINPYIDIQCMFYSATVKRRSRLAGTCASLSRIEPLHNSGIKTVIKTTTYQFHSTHLTRELVVCKSQYSEE